MHKDEFTLEQLATATGMTARNVRAYQTKGLIPAPSRAGRRSVYGVEHLQRLQAIERARRHGASLSLIAAHLAAGRPLDDDTLVDWDGPGSDPARWPAFGRRTGTAGAGAPSEEGEPTHDIAPLLAQLDAHRDPGALADVQELIAAGVLQPEGTGVYTGRELAQSLLELQRQEFPLHTALGVAQRTLAAAAPLTAALREVTEVVDATTRHHLGEVACCVLRHLISTTTPAEDVALHPSCSPSSVGP